MSSTLFAAVYTLGPNQLDTSPLQVLQTNFCSFEHAGIALQRGVLPKLFNALSTNTSLRTLELCALPICDAPEAPHTAAGAEDAIATPMHDADPPMHDVPASGEQASTSNGTSRETRASAKRKRDGVNAPVATAQGSKPPGAVSD